MAQEVASSVSCIGRGLAMGWMPGALPPSFVVRRFAKCALLATLGRLLVALFHSLVDHHVVRPLNVFQQQDDGTLDLGGKEGTKDFVRCSCLSTDLWHLRMS